MKDSKIEWCDRYGTQTDKEADVGHRDDEPDVYRIGKKAAGRLLDGVGHRAFPENQG